MCVCVNIDACINSYIHSVFKCFAVFCNLLNLKQNQIDPLKEKICASNERASGETNSEQDKELERETLRKKALSLASERC